MLKMPRSYFTILIVFSLTGMILTAASTVAQSAGDTGVATKKVLTGEIRGYVLDESGKPVPAATVTLWQSGQVWKPGKVVFGYHPNPQATGIYDVCQNDNAPEGYYSFGIVDTGDYVLTFEKDGHTSTLNVTVSTESVPMMSMEEYRETYMLANVTLEGYHVPALSPAQLACAGSLSGTVYTKTGTPVLHANVSLWKDGQLVAIPGNPQLSEDDQNGIPVYRFEHLAPGTYEVRASKFYLASEFSNSTNVTVGSGQASGDVHLDNLVFSSIQVTTPVPSETAAPSVPSSPMASPIGTSVSIPAPGVTFPLVLLSLCAAIAIAGKLGAGR